ncbi:hypothetical protein GCM10008944_01000 [Cytobacillus oceanisediminis]
MRALLAMGLVVGLGSVNTMAFWTDDAVLDAGTIQTGSLDLLVAGNLAGAGGTTTSPSLALTDMVPGESVAVTVPVQRAASTVGFTYTAKATASGALAPYLRWTVSAGSAGTASSSGLRTNTCGGTPLVTGVTLTGTASDVIASPRTLSGATMSENICLRVELPSGTANAAQGASATASFVFDATQLG